MKPVRYESTVMIHFALHKSTPTNISSEGCGTRRGCGTWRGVAPGGGVAPEGGMAPGGEWYQERV